ATAHGSAPAGVRTPRRPYRAHRRSHPAAGARCGAEPAGGTVSAPATVTVSAEREYPVLIGPGITDALAEHLPCGVRVFLMHPRALSQAVRPVVDALTAAGHQVLVHATADGEGAKTSAVAAE